MPANILAAMKIQKAYLSKREQQLMELVYEHGKLTTPQATELLPGSSANSTVRTLLKILEDKGHLRHEEVNGKYTYYPTHPRKAAAHQAIQNVAQTFFRGSVGGLMLSLLSEPTTNLSESEIEQMEALILKAKEEGK